MALNNFPYTDNNIINLDALFRIYSELRAALDGGIKEIVAEQIGQLFLDAVYDPEQEKLTLTLQMGDDT